MNMSDEGADIAQCRGGIRLLDVHMKKIREDAHVREVRVAKPRRGVADAVKQIRFVAIQRLIKERNVVAGGVAAEILERLGKKAKGVGPRGGGVPPTLHGTDDR